MVTSPSPIGKTKLTEECKEYLKTSIPLMLLYLEPMAIHSITAEEVVVAEFKHLRNITPRHFSSTFTYRLDGPSKNRTSRIRSPVAAMTDGDTLPDIVESR